MSNDYLDKKYLKIQKKGHSVILKLSRPEVLNAVNQEMLEELLEFLDEIEKDKSVRCIILTGDGDRAFVTGGDLKEELDCAKNDPSKVVVFNESGRSMILKMLHSRLPIITAVNGYAYGLAIGLITASDIVIASEDSTFGLPTTKLGGVPGWGCTQTFARTVGHQNAKMMLFLNRSIDAEEAFRVGLVNIITRKEQLMDEALKMAEIISKMLPEAVAATKYAINQGMEGSLRAGLDIEASMLNKMNITPNYQEGASAFLEKREAEFK